jgi:starvation-inducible outer membrane lipoprotein
MIRITPLAVVAGSLLLSGCGTEPFTLEKQGEKVATSMGRTLKRCDSFPPAM